MFRSEVTRSRLGHLGLRARHENCGDIRDDTTQHSELVIGDGVIMVGSSNTDAQPRLPFKAHFKSPKSLGGANTQSLMVYIDDADAHCARAKAAGAEIFMEPSVHDYGEDHWADRSYGAGAVRSGLPSAVRGIPCQGRSSHWAAAGTVPAMSTNVASKSLICLRSCLPLALDWGQTPTINAAAGTATGPRCESPRRRSRHPCRRR